MSDVVQRTVYWYKDKVNVYDATDGITLVREYIKFLPFCKVLINGKGYVEPWNGVVTANWKVNDVNMQNFNPSEESNMITSMEEIDPHKFRILLSGDANDTRLHGGELNTRIGK